MYTRRGPGRTPDMSHARWHPTPVSHGCEDYVCAVDCVHFKYSGDYIIENLTSMHDKIGLLCWIWLDLVA